MNAAEPTTKGTPTRADIAALLVSIGRPGEKRAEKYAAVAALNLTNPQTLGGHALELTLESYAEY